ncbi:hypothetical protein PTT_19113 [Pyrenophora teres f. teres 0-1]|uniref:Uncharacterized protein n=1 Tax=Pyrenophora teres f. teres (strain 0-1) TaxID=861557 RepID=E3S880_PYRTT|nr:hypothetical protein PTT_19113 [Pyrenophora teres f. teres 0-1]
MYLPTLTIALSLLNAVYALPPTRGERSVAVPEVFRRDCGTWGLLRLLSSATSNKEGSLLDAGRMARGYWAPQACKDMALHEQGEVSDP